MTYEIRRPGHTAWAEQITTLAEAIRELDRANRDVQPGHVLYVVAGNGERYEPEYDREEVLAEDEATS
jgi:hypothetical protein